MSRTGRRSASGPHFSSNRTWFSSWVTRQSISFASNDAWQLWWTNEPCAMSSRRSISCKRLHRSSSSNPPISKRSSNPPTAWKDEVRTARQNPTSRRASDVSPPWLARHPSANAAKASGSSRGSGTGITFCLPDTLSEHGPTAPTSVLRTGARSSSSQPEGTTVSLFRNTTTPPRAFAAPWLHPRANPWFSSFATTSSHP